MVFTINRIHHDFSGAEGADADAHKVGVVERCKHVEVHVVGHKQVCKTFTLNLAILLHLKTKLYYPYNSSNRWFLAAEKADETS